MWMPWENRKVSAPALVPCRKRGNPGSILTVVCLLLVVVWFHVLFYQTTSVHLPTSTAGPRNNVLHHQISTARKLSGQRALTGPLNVSTAPQSGLNSTSAPYQWMINPAVERLGRERSDIRIIARSSGVVRNEAGRRYSQ